MAFKKDFGSYIKNNGLSKGGKIIITKNFVPLTLVLYPGGLSSITANINEMLASFDFNEEVLKVFLSIFQEFKLIDKLSLTEQIQKQIDQPIIIRFTDSPILLRIVSIVLSCELGNTEKSAVTDEEFTPLIITEAKIVQKPVGVFVSSLGEIM